MADIERKWVCKVGEDPKNPNTAGAVATIFDANDGKSYYHLAKKNASASGLDKALSKVFDGYTPDQHGPFSFSQVSKSGAVLANPLGLSTGHRPGITVEFSGGKISECRIDTDSEAGKPIPIVDKVPQPTAGTLEKTLATPAPASAP